MSMSRISGNEQVGGTRLGAHFFGTEKPSINHPLFTTKSHLPGDVCVKLKYYGLSDKVRREREKKILLTKKGITF